MPHKDIDIHIVTLICVAVYNEAGERLKLADQTIRKLDVLDPKLEESDSHI